MVGGCQTFTDDNSERYHAGDSFNILAGWWELDVIIWTYCTFARKRISFVFAWFSPRLFLVAQSRGYVLVRQ